LSGGRSRVLPSEAGISGDDDPGRTAGSFSSVAGTDSNFFVLQNARSPKIVIALCTIRGVCLAIPRPLASVPDLHEPLRPELYRYCRHLTRSPWDADDLVQDACRACRADAAPAPRREARGASRDGPSRHAGARGRCGASMVDEFLLRAVTATPDSRRRRRGFCRFPRASIESASRRARAVNDARSAAAV